ncbi:MAG TPA: heme ABC transporter ATP-binding protein [Edaphocola sp.]|nr:heme ABC transporter ATP-binding protein [Edaphocola sp.]
MIQAKNISYTPQKIKILNQIDLQMSCGELVVIVGPNGAGKSTLLSMLANEQKPHQGEIIFKSKNLNQWEAENLAFQKAKFSQEHHSDIGLAVKDIVLMGRYPYFGSQPKTADWEIVDKMMHQLEIYHLKEKNYNILSGGEKQRVHLSRTFAQLSNNESQKLAFFDEPLNNLDIRHQYRILEQMRQFAEDGNTAVAVLHDLNLAAQYAHKIILMKKGEILAQGTPEEIIKEEWISKAYDFPCVIMANPLTHQPMVLFKTN